MRRESVIYITYDGLLTPLGQSQVLGYLEPLAADYSFHLISFEKKADRESRDRMDAMHRRLNKAGISWMPLAYHKTPTAPATAFDTVIGTAVALRLAFQHNAKIIHVRSYVPALMALPIRRLTNIKLLFDIRGFWPDERADSGMWPKSGRLYRATKRFEERFFSAADHVVTLTHASVPQIERLPFLAGRVPPISVIPTCANLERFAPAPPPPPHPFVFGYVGSAAGWYLFDETLSFFTAIRRRRPDAQLLIVNRNEHDQIRAAVARAGIVPSAVELVAADHEDVPRHIARMHVGAAVVKPCYSAIARAPTKLAEYLGCGVPCVTNDGGGDTRSIVENNRVGVALSGFSEPSLNRDTDRLLALVDDPATRSRCVDAARRIFSVDDGVAAYRRVYAQLLGKPTPSPAGDIRRVSAPV